MNTYSYHIFYFPFKWDLKNFKDTTLSEQIDMGKININPSSAWQRIDYINDDEAQSIYNEKNYYYQFVHKALYDEKNRPDNIITHYERMECRTPGAVTYNIKIKNRDLPLTLNVEAININIYSTGVGLLSFYLANQQEDQSDPQSILAINQYGRRIMPPFFNDIAFRRETSEYIRIDGLKDVGRYYEDFKKYTTNDTWQQASFITNLVMDLSPNIDVTPIVDDRMFVSCWYKNDQLAKAFTSKEDAYYYQGEPTITSEEEEKLFSNFWHKFLYIDYGSVTCQNKEMREKLLKEHTYPRWQNWSSLYGCTRYSMVYLTDSNCPEHLTTTFQTIYSRMIELVLVQRISTLRFSEEVTKVSNLSNQEVTNISVRVSSLYKEYIRFVNQIYFRSVTAQEQGIEIYTMMQNNLHLREYISDLDEEIGELFNYVFLKEERTRNDKATFLNDIAVLLLPVSIITGFFGMNAWNAVFNQESGIDKQFILLTLGVIFAIFTIIKRKKRL